MKPTFSVIIPIYNGAIYIRECLNSLLNQSFKNFEIIIIDDHSTDCSFDICKEYQEKDNRIILKKNKLKGVSSARETGIEVAQGDYLVFVDSDDFVKENLFEKLQLYIGFDVIRYGNFIYKNSNKIVEVLPKEKGIYDKKRIEREIFSYLIQDSKGQYYCPSLWAHAIKRDLFVNNMLSNSDIAMGEDGACIIPCIFNANSLIVINECLYFYRYNSNSTTKLKKMLDYKYPLKIIEHIQKKINTNLFTEQIYRKVVHELFHVIISYFYQEIKYRTIKKDIKEKIYSIDFYEESIQKSIFINLKGKLLSFCMKNKIFIPIYIYARLGLK